MASGTLFNRFKNPPFELEFAGFWMESKLDKFLSLTGYNGIFIIIRTLNLIIQFWMTSKFLGPTLFGEYSYYIIVIEILNLLTSLGVSNSIPRYFAEFVSQRKNDEAKAVLALVLRLKMVLLVIICAAFVIVQQVFAGAKLFDIGSDIVLIIVLCLIGESILDFAQNIVDGLLQNKFKLFVYTFMAFFRISAMYVVLSTHPSIILLLMISVVASFLNSVIFVAYNFRYIPANLKLRLSDENIGRVRSAIGYQSLTAILVFIIWDRSELFFLKQYSSAIELGLYSFAFSLSSRLVKFVPSFFVGVLIPFLSHLKNRDDIDTGYFYLSKYLIILGFLGATAGFILAPPAIAIIWGTSYAKAVRLCQILLFATAIAQISNVGVAVLQRLDKQNVNFYISLVLAVVNISLDIWLIPRYQALGATIANSVTQSSLMILFVSYFTFFNSKRFPWRVFVLACLQSILFIGLYEWSSQYLGDMQSLTLNVSYHAGYLVLYAVTFLVISKFGRILDKMDMWIVTRASSRLPTFAKRALNRVLEVIGPSDLAESKLELREKETMF